jgi:hypothetical protein
MPPHTILTLVTWSPALRMTIISLHDYLVIGALVRLINASRPGVR